MKRKIIALTSVLIGIILVGPVAAQTSQGLEMTVDVGNHYYYNVFYWEEGIYLHEDMYVNISSNHAVVPDPLTDWWDIPEPPASLYYANGTSPGLMALVFIYATKLFVPIGNWTLMTELFENVTYWDFFSEDIENASVFKDTWLHWGYSYNITVETGEIMCNNTYLKSNGALARQDLVAYNATYDITFGEIIILCDGVAPEVENPDDIAYEEGETGHSISWNATDQSPGGYLVLKDDVEVTHGFWNSTSEVITMNVDGLSVGSHNYTIVFMEASGISTSDTVMVDISAPPTTPTTTTTTTTTPTVTSPTTTTTDGFDLTEFLSQNILIIGVGGGVVLLIIVIVVLRKR